MFFYIYIYAPWVLPGFYIKACMRQKLTFNTVILDEFAACFGVCTYANLLSLKGSRCGRADSVMDLYTTGPGFKTQSVRHFLLSFRLFK